MTESRPGYIRLWRKTLDSGILPHPGAWQVFGYCLLHAMWKSQNILTEQGMVKLKRGQFITGRKKMSRELHTTEQKIRTALKLLSNMEIITIETTNNFSIITLKNWDKYQSTDGEATNKTTNDQPTTNQPPTTEEEGKKERKILEPSVKIKKRPDSWLLKKALAEYYEVFDPRHPAWSEKRNNSTLQSQWEAKHGKPWKPKPPFDETTL